jgi:hypothetical protein
MGLALSQTPASDHDWRLRCFEVGSSWAAQNKQPSRRLGSFYGIFVDPCIPSFGSPECEWFMRSLRLIIVVIFAWMLDEGMRVREGRYIICLDANQSEYSLTSMRTWRSVEVADGNGRTA